MFLIFLALETVLCRALKEFPLILEADSADPVASESWKNYPAWA